MNMLKLYNRLDNIKYKHSQSDKLGTDHGFTPGSTPFPFSGTLPVGNWTSGDGGGARGPKSVTQSITTMSLGRRGEFSETITCRFPGTFSGAVGVFGSGFLSGVVKFEVST